MALVSLVLSFLFFWLIPAQDFFILLKYKLRLPEAVGYITGIFLCFLIIYFIFKFFSKFAPRFFSFIYVIYLVIIFPLSVLSLFYYLAQPQLFSIVPVVLLVCIVGMFYEKVKRGATSVLLISLVCLATSLISLNIFSVIYYSGGEGPVGYGSFIYCFQNQEGSIGCNYSSEEDWAKRGSICVIDVDNDPLNGCQGQ